jgi:CheY-like chemotaxis protein
LQRAARILVAEDNISSQQVALAILHKLGCRADAVANGKEALASLRSIPYDLVLMDCQMPEMSGYEATACIRDPHSGVCNPEIPVVALTAYAMNGDREKCLAAGMNDYISKPVHPAALEAVLAKWLPERTAGPAGAAFDEASLLERLMGDRDLAHMVVAGFLEDMPRQLYALESRLAARDADAVRMQAHRIAGACVSVSAGALRKVASELEEAARAGDLRAMTCFVPELQRQFQAAAAAMGNVKSGVHAGKGNFHENSDRRG